MKLVEKKCPNCGAGLSFNDTDKSCKCDYCKRAFEIERDNTIDSSASINDQYQLSELKGPLKIVGLYFAGTYIVGAIITIIVFILVGVIGYNIYKHASNQLSDSNNNSIINKKSNAKYITSIDDLDNDDYEDIDSDSNIEIKRSGNGVNNAYHSYSRDGDPKREKVYVAYKKDDNVIIAIYKAIYKDFFHQENSYTVYVPIVYENIKKNEFGIYEWDNPQVKAPEYYFDSEHKSYTYGYNSIADAYNSVVKPLENDYKISQK
ncbi:MAG: hypothetical protein E7160_02685 [Firmicutes bacterium]|nr:hypothetical protein [Bacillota bacterium]